MGPPLIDAIIARNLDLVKSLIQTGADVNKEDQRNNFRPLNYAIPRGTEYFMVLVEAGADINYKFGISQTLLLQAIDEQNLDIVKYLVDHGVNVNLERNPHRHTPLYQAVIKPSLEIVEYLVEHGARIDVVTRSNETILNYAIINGPSGNLPLIRYLVENLHMDINTQDKYGKTPLHNAIERGDINYVKYLVDHGAGLDIPDRNGITPWNLGLNFYNNKTNQDFHLYSQFGLQFAFLSLLKSLK